MLFWKAPTSSSQKYILIGQLIAPTQIFGCSRNVLLSAPSQTVPVSSNQGFFSKPPPIALTRTTFLVICSHLHGDLETQIVLYYPAPSPGQLFQFLANKGFLKSPDQ